MIHKQLAEGRWFTLSLMEQLANIGSEVERAMSWRAKQQEELATQASIRALELFDLTIQDERHRYRLKEITRARELWCDYFYGDNQYRQTREQWQKYFYHFTYAARNLSLRG